MTHAIADASPARALHRLAHDLHAALVVIGSTHRGPVGRVLAGTTADRLLHGSPCPVAIAPHGFAAGEPRAIETIGVGYDGSEEAQGAVNAALTTAGRFGARLRVVRVFDAAQVGTPALMAGGGYMALHKETSRRSQREDLDRLVAALPEDVAAEAVFLSGSPGRELVAQSESVDVLFAGSRGYGPVRSVLLGTVSHALVCGAACPVMVLPRGAHGGLDELFAHRRDDRDLSDLAPGERRRATHSARSSVVPQGANPSCPRLPRALGRANVCHR